MIDLREDLERESRRVSLAPGASGRMFERRSRRDRRQRIGAVAVGLALLLGSADLAGTYVARLPERDPDVSRLGLAGVYALRLGADGSLTMTGPREIDLPGPPIAFSVTGHELVTDFLVGHGCDGEGTYRWSLRDGELVLTEMNDACGLRSVLLSTAPWSSTAAPASPDFLQGDWVATFTCDEMVSAVEQAPASTADEAHWRAGNAEALGSPDPTDPCAASPPPFAITLHFTPGRLRIYDASGSEGFDGRYDLNGNILTIRDPRTKNIDGEYRLAFVAGPNSLEFRLLGRGATDPWFVYTWQVAPFVREG